MELTPTNVDTIMRQCLADTGEPTRGVTHSYIFDPAKIDEAKPTIAALLYQLPDSFMRTKGGGMSFLNMCERRDGVLWTGLHLTMESLVVLGVAAGLVSFSMPRDFWSALPAGMPYLTIDDEAIKAVYAGEPV